MRNHRQSRNFPTRGTFAYHNTDSPTLVEPLATELMFVKGDGRKRKNSPRLHSRRPGLRSSNLKTDPLDPKMSLKVSETPPR